MKIRFVSLAASVSVWAGLAMMPVYTQAQVQNKPAAQWPEKDVPGDSKSVITIAAGGDPDGCQVTVSPRYGCEAIKCRGTHSVTFNDQRGQMNALKIALAQAKSHMAAFLKEEISKKGNIDLIDSALKKESSAGNSAERVTAESVKTSIQSSASAILRGVTVFEQGVDTSVAYATVVTSCGSRTAAASVEQQMTAPQGEGRQAAQGLGPTFNSPAGTTSVRRSKEGF